MNLGIITYHNTRNCGAVLQAYALQRVLIDRGIKTDIIDYRCREIEQTYKIKKIKDIKGLKELVKWALTVQRDKITQKKFDQFKRKHIKLSSKYDRTNIQNANEYYDAFVTGSDQVWNFNLNGGDTVYLLDFAGKGKKKISYAASMGGSAMPPGFAEKTARALQTFDAVSVRETALAQYIKTLTGAEPQTVLDPTLLLTKERYAFEEKEKPKKKYIFVYTIANTPNIERCAKALSRETGFPVIWGHMSYRKKSGVENMTTLSPVEFVNYIRNAEYVLTSSFHGMAFSVIMEKQFFYDLDKGEANNNSRLETLAELLNLQCRELNEADLDLTQKRNIDYNTVSRLLNDARQRSLVFLGKSVCFDCENN